MTKKQAKDRNKRVFGQEQPSRRRLIIVMLQDNLWDTGTLADALELWGYKDRKANKKAIAGTQYDLGTNKGVDYRKCDNERLWINK